jgi:hypothetical protein
VSLVCGSCMEREKACPDAACRSSWPVGERERPKRRNREGLSTDAGCAGGPACSSCEALVMRVERRGWVIRGCCSFGQPGVDPGGAGWAS